MSTTDPRRNDDGSLGEPATAVAANASSNRDHTPDQPAPAVAAEHDRTADAEEHGGHAASAGPDGAIQDTERDDRDTARTRVLPSATEGQTAGNDRRAADERPTVVTPAVAPPPAQPAEDARTEPRLDPRSVLAREKEEFGGMRFLLAFFGWLTATGLAVLLVAIAGGILAAVGSSNGSASSTTGLQSLGIAGAIVTAVIIFVAYYAGGYVAGRMARFSGAKQGVAVWLWAIIFSVIAAIAGAIGSQFGLFSQVGSVAQVQLSPQTLTVAGIVGIVAALALSLVGAVLGGLAGMRFHRKVDRAAFGA
jgi:hypothetical protein